MEHLQARLDVLRLHPARAHMLGGARHARIGGVDVDFQRRRHLAADDRALIEVQMLECIDHAGDVVAHPWWSSRDRRRSSHRRCAPLRPRCRNKRASPRAPCRASGPDRAARSGAAACATVSSTKARGKISRPSGVSCAPARVMYSMPLGVASASPMRLEHIERGMVNAQHIGIGQRLVAPARHPRLHRTQVIGQRRRPRRAARCARSASGHLRLYFAHPTPSLTRAGARRISQNALLDGRSARDLLRDSNPGGATGVNARSPQFGRLTALAGQALYIAERRLIPRGALSWRGDKDQPGPAMAVHPDSHSLSPAGVSAASRPPAVAIVSFPLIRPTRHSPAAPFARRAIRPPWLERRAPRTSRALRRTPTARAFRIDTPSRSVCR